MPVNFYFTKPSDVTCVAVKNDPFYFSEMNELYFSSIMLFSYGTFSGNF